jgi:hypothetical protein
MPRKSPERGKILISEKYDLNRMMNDDGSRKA